MLLSGAARSVDVCQLSVCSLTPRRTYSCAAPNRPARARRSSAAAAAAPSCQIPPYSAPWCRWGYQCVEEQTSRRLGVMVVAVVRKDHVTYARPSVLRQLHAAIGVYRLRTSHHVQEALKTSQRARQGSRSLCISISRCSSRWRGRGRDFNVSALAPGPACPAPLKRCV